jgi:hypothetical protein
MFARIEESLAIVCGGQPPASLVSFERTRLTRTLSLSL